MEKLCSRTTPLTVWVLASTLMELTGMSLVSRSDTDLPMSENLTGVLAICSGGHTQPARVGVTQGAQR